MRRNQPLNIQRKSTLQEEGTARAKAVREKGDCLLEDIKIGQCTWSMISGQREIVRSEIQELAYTQMVFNLLQASKFSFPQLFFEGTSTILLCYVFTSLLKFQLADYEDFTGFIAMWDSIAMWFDVGTIMLGPSSSPRRLEGAHHCPPAVWAKPVSGQRAILVFLIQLCDALIACCLSQQIADLHLV